MECGQMKEILENFQGEVNLSCSFNIMCHILGRNMADFWLPFSSRDFLFYEWWIRGL